MAKRLTDTEKWRDPWFRKLHPTLKCIWNYICDNCDNSGVWKVDMESIEFFVGDTRSKDLILTTFEDRVSELTKDYWLIKKFVPFQYGELSEDSRPHKQVLNLIEKHRVSIGYPKGIDTLKDKDKDKEGVKDVKDKRYGEKDIREQYGEFVLLSKDEFVKLQALLGSRFQSYLDRLDGYIGQIGVKKATQKYRSHYHTIRNWHRKDIEEGKISGTHDSTSHIDIKAELRAKKQAERTRSEAPAGKVFDGIRDSAIVPPSEGRGSIGGTNS